MVKIGAELPKVS